MDYKLEEFYRAQGRTFCDSNITSYRSWWTPPIFWQQPSQIRINGGIDISNLDIYPNPSRDLFNISFVSETKQNLSLRILNIIGEEIYVEDKFDYIGEYTKQINLEKYSQGVYFLEIETNNGIINKKLYYNKLNIKNEKLLFIIIAFLVAFQIQASHLMGGEITWKCIKSGPNAGSFVFTLKVYRDCQGVPINTTNSLVVHNVPGLTTIPLNYISVFDLSPNCNTVNGSNIQFSCGSNNLGYGGNETELLRNIFLDQIQ